MSADLKARLREWFEERAEFGPLPLPPDLDPALLRSPERWAQALEQAARPAGPPQTPGHDPFPRSASNLSLRAHGTPSPTQAPAPASRPAVAPVAVAAPLELCWNSLDELRGVVAGCRLCTLCERRTQTVFGVGSPEADLVIVGEAPGEQEDLQGEPFVGPAGQLLDKMLAAIGFARADVFICNTLKCRPPFNRDPNPQELAACRPYLDHQLHFLKPKLLLALGKVAGQALLGRESTLGAMRGVEHSYRGVPLRISYHPAALLRNTHWKRPAWEDLQAAKRRYDDLGGKPGSLPGAVAGS